MADADPLFLDAPLQAGAAATTRTANAAWLRALERTAAITPDDARILAQIVDARAATDPARPALVGEDAALTYGELADVSRRVAGWAMANGLRRGDRVALLAENAPAYPAIWLGLSRVGIVTALINTQLVGSGLRHCLAAAEARHLVVDAARAADVAEADTLSVWTLGTPDRPGTFDAAVAGSAPSADRNAPVVALRDPALLIYTSGTTGLPKAAVVSHYRIVMWSEWFAGLIDARREDRLYDCLPMYHSVGGVVAIGAMLAAGGTVIVRRRFSASRFWPDVVASGATVFQYIGELCRFLVDAPPCADERRHALRLIIGNGLREQVWRAFVARFSVPRVVEFYAATEGSFSLFNLDGRPGAIGRIPGFMAHRSPVALVRLDAATEQPERGADGFCRRCAADEPGEAIGKLDAGSGGLATRFEGYTSAAESERKILRDVFATGDAWFRTGDLMRRDAQGFFFFVDRIGDTFRWKGENVSTTEVADVLGAAPGVLDACVYGVVVPEAEGRAGMGALATGPGFDLAALHAHVAANLPRHARPLVLRLGAVAERTGTFRQRKAELRDAGFDPALVGDPLFLDTGAAYTRLDAAMHARIVAGALRL